MSNDVKLCSKARKVVISCWFDIARVRLRVTRGIIHVAGTVTLLGEDPHEPESNVPFLVKLDEQLRLIPSYRGIHYAFDNWRREPSGGWRYTGKKVRGARKSG